MTAPFEFLRGIPPYTEDKKSIERLNNRHRLLIDPFQPWIKGARVLDLACHDGRWSYALAAAGADEVLGIEARHELIDRFEHFPDAPFKSRVKLHCEDMFAALEDMAARGERFNVVTLFGIFYHIMDHYRLLNLIRRLKPKIIIIDSELIMVDNALIQVLTETTDNPLNAAPEHDHQTRIAVGVPSHRAVEFMAETLDYEVSWLQSGLLLGDECEGMHDYFRPGRKQRGVCVLSVKKPGQKT
jgi:2-polyprenyl-3-methyl-5-hydroxy-6-metoxy-1,4-benzoquinol methylase